MSLVLALFGAGNAFAAGVVPLPAEVTAGDGAFHIDAKTQVCVTDPMATETAHYLVDLLARSRNLKLGIRRCTAGTHAILPEARTITFSTAPGFEAEGYRLEVTPQRVAITATTGAGLFYGAVTLWQLLPAGAGQAEVSSQVIRDAPVYRWRGLMLDSARHFQSVEFVKSMIDWMALHKLNVFHWHLTDDQGWRLEIRKYPRLTSVGAWRTPATPAPAAVAAPAVAAPAAGKHLPRYGGFYTQRQVRDVVAFAASRHVQVVPEIDLPGHAQAAIAAYPWLGSADGPPPPVSARWGVHTYLFNPQPATLAFLKDVFTEVMDLFPSHEIHIGGDEVGKDQTYFTQEMSRFLTLHGRRLVGWDEILRPGLAHDAIVMSWRGTTGAHAAALAGNDTVLSPWPTLYFDNQQSKLLIEPPGRMKVISLEDVYAFDLRDESLTPAQRSHVLGVQANIWTEHIRTEERVEWMTFPRAAAIAEIGWTAPERRHWPDFVQRVAPTLAKYRSLGLHAADSAFAVDASVTPGPDGAVVTLSNQTGFGEIRYSTDGHDPTASSAKYSGALSLPANADLRAATFPEGAAAPLAAPVSDVLHRRLSPATLGRRGSRELDLCSDGISLLLEPSAAGAPAAHGRAGTPRPIFAIDIMNPCWIYRGVDLTRGAKLAAAVGELPFNFEIGADAQKIRVGDSRTPAGELEIRLDGCDGAPTATAPLTPLAADAMEAQLPPIDLAPRPGRHDICLRFARPRLDPMWALDWVEIGQ